MSFEEMLARGNVRLGKCRKTLRWGNFCSVNYLFGELTFGKTIYRKTVSLRNVFGKLSVGEMSGESRSEKFPSGKCSDAIH